MAEVILKEVEKIYPNGFKAVHGIDLKIENGEFMVLVGPSGCAKSTTLRMVAGLEEITGGEIWIGDKCVNDLPPKDRGIAMVFQNYALYPHMTAYENIAFALELQKMPVDEIEKRVMKAAEKLGITDILDKKPRAMSGGQQQRIAVGRAIVRKPEVFLFDEPLSNLDAKLRASLRIQIKQLHNQLKEEGSSATMIYVTHDQVEAMTMGDRICVLDHGRIIQVDTPYNLYHRPNSKFVANFIGSPTMNIVKTNIEKENDKLVVRLGTHSLVISDEKAKKLENYINKKVYFGIRPESIKLNKIAEANKDNLVLGMVKVVEHLGNEEIIYFEVEGTQFISVQDSDKNFTTTTGKEQEFEFDMDEIHIFDFDTEKNISL